MSCLATSCEKYAEVSRERQYWSRFSFCFTVLDRNAHPSVSNDPQTSSASAVAGNVLYFTLYNYTLVTSVFQAEAAKSTCFKALLANAPKILHLCLY